MSIKGMAPESLVSFEFEWWSKEQMEYTKNGIPRSLMVTEDELCDIKCNITSVFRKASILVTDSDYCKNDVKAVALKLFDITCKSGSEILRATDAFDAGVKLIGKTIVGQTLSKLSATQCSGLVGMIVTTVAPQVRVNEYHFLTIKCNFV